MSQVYPDHIAGKNALIAVGSNQESSRGNPHETVTFAVKALQAAFGASARISKFYSTPAFPAGAGPAFVNAAAVVSTTLEAEAVLAKLHAIEHQAERMRGVRWGQRTLDLDLIAIDGDIVPDLAGFMAWRDLPLDAQMARTPDRLILPHPRMQDRVFVLVPLADVAADWRHPVSGLTVAQMRDACAPADLASVTVFDGEPRTIS